MANREELAIIRGARGGQRRGPARTGQAVPVRQRRLAAKPAHGAALARPRRPQGCAGVRTDRRPHPARAGAAEPAPAGAVVRARLRRRHAARRPGAGPADCSRTAPASAGQAARAPRRCARWRRRPGRRCRSALAATRATAGSAGARRRAGRRPSRAAARVARRRRQAPARRLAVAAPRAAQPLACSSRLWQSGRPARSYLARALPLARALVATAPAARAAASGAGATSPCCRAARARWRRRRRGSAASTRREIHAFWELAAAEHDRHAQLAIGLWYARMQVDGTAGAGGGGAANFKKAIRWLLLAGEQGLAEAWYALSRIYIKPEFSQRNVADAQRYLERAAEMGIATPSSNAATMPGARAAKTKATMCAPCTGCRRRRPGLRAGRRRPCTRSRRARGAGRIRTGALAGARRRPGRAIRCWRRGCELAALFGLSVPKRCCSTCRRPTRAIAW